MESHRSLKFSIFRNFFSRSEQKNSGEALFQQALEVAQSQDFCSAINLLSQAKNEFWNQGNQSRHKDAQDKIKEFQPRCHLS